MATKLMRTFQQKMAMLITIDFATIEFKDLGSKTNTAKYCIRFDRGKTETKQTAWKSLDIDRIAIEYQNERFVRKSQFYFTSEEV